MTTERPTRTTISNNLRICVDRSRGGSDSESDGDYSKRSGYRRPKRKRPIDPSRELIILRPGDDLEALGLTSKALADFESSFDYASSDDSDDNERIEASVMTPVVYTPRVQASSAVLRPRPSAFNSAMSFMLNSPLSSSTKHSSSSSCSRADLSRVETKPVVKLEKRGRGRPRLNKSTDVEIKATITETVEYRCPESASYAEYDADTDDENFLDYLSKTSSDKSTSGSSISSALSIDELESIIKLLEREVEVSKRFFNLKSRLEIFETDCHVHIENSNLLGRSVEEFLNNREGSPNENLERYLHRSSQLQSSPYSWPLSASGKLGVSGSYIAPLTFSKVKEDRDRDSDNGDRDRDSVSDGEASMSRQHCFNSSATDDSEKLHIITKEELKLLVPESRAVYLIKSVLKPENVNSVHGKGSGKVAVKEKDVEKVASSIYHHWVKKRRDRSSSLLRCFHNFIMENWLRSDNLPPLPDDKVHSELADAHCYLTKIRYNLDRARLIVDRVRRREKLKRELVRSASDAFDEATSQKNALPLMSTQAVQKSEAKKTQANTKNKRHKPLLDTECESDDASVGSSDFLKFAIEPVDDSAFSDFDYERDLNLLNTSFKHRRTEDSQFKAFSHKEEPRALTFSRHPIIPVSQWTADEDKLLLLGIAVFGIGHWTEIRDFFTLSKKSVVMNQRFSKFAKHRNAVVNGSTSVLQKLNVDEPIRCVSMSSSQRDTFRSSLPVAVRKLLDEFSEDKVWEGIAVRHLLDIRSSEKRCGRPPKNVMQIPVSKELRSYSASKLVSLASAFNLQEKSCNDDYIFLPKPTTSEPVVIPHFVAPAEQAGFTSVKNNRFSKNTAAVVKNTPASVSPDSSVSGCEEEEVDSSSDAGSKVVTISESTIASRVRGSLVGNFKPQETQIIPRLDDISGGRQLLCRSSAAEDRDVSADTRGRRAKVKLAEPPPTAEDSDEDSEEEDEEEDDDEEED